MFSSRMFSDKLIYHKIDVNEFMGLWKFNSFYDIIKRWEYNNILDMISLHHGFVNNGRVIVVNCLSLPRCLRLNDSDSPYVTT